MASQLQRVVSLETLLVAIDPAKVSQRVWLATGEHGLIGEPVSLPVFREGVDEHRRQLVVELKVLRQRLHAQLNVLCPGLSAPQGHGRVLDLLRPSGRAVLACAAAFAGRPASTRSLLARAPGRLSRSSASYWAQRWRQCLPPPSDAELRAERLTLDLQRLQALLRSLAATDAQTAALLAQTDGQVLTSLPGVAVVRAAAFAAHSLPIERYPKAEHLYSSTGLAPASYESGTISRRGGISRQGLAEHRDALMAIAWGLSQAAPAFRERAREYRARGFAPIQVRVALARHACRLCHALLRNREPYDEARYRQSRRRGR